MKRLTILVVLISLGLLLVACGGSSGEAESAAVESNTSNEETVVEETAEEEPEEVVVEETAEEEPEEVVEEEPEEESTEEEAAEEETAEEEIMAEEESASGFGDLPLTGTDAESGLVINPPKVNPGESAVVRGEIISMNLTPTTSPEYLIQIEDGTKYRFRGQDLADTYFLDGSQLKAFEYKLGMLAQATVTLAADAGPSDLAVSDNVTLIAMGE